MTKRAFGKFEPRPRDFIATPMRAVLPLITFLDGGDFAEPCAGENDLVRHLESLGMRCVYAGDIATGQDALDWRGKFEHHQIITNPPWSWALFQPLLEHFIATGLPVWLLLSADWAHTNRAKHYMHYCSHIVSVGRLKWIEGSPHQGFDNVAWYRFQHRHCGYPLFVPRMAV